MLGGFIVTVLSSVVVLWVSFALSGKDELAISTMSGLGNWHTKRVEATIIKAEEVSLKRGYRSLRKSGEVVHKGVRLTIEYPYGDRETRVSEHLFYNETVSDKVQVNRMIKENLADIWVDSDGGTYVPYEISQEEGEEQEIYGADKVFSYTVLWSLLVSAVSTVVLGFISPMWVPVNLMVLFFMAFGLQGHTFIQEMTLSSRISMVSAVEKVKRSILWEDSNNTGLDKYLLVEQPVCKVLLDNGEGYLGYKREKVIVLEDSDGKINNHFMEEFRFPEGLKGVVSKIKNQVLS